MFHLSIQSTNFITPPYKLWNIELIGKVEQQSLIFGMKQTKHNITKTTTINYNLSTGEMMPLEP